MDQPNDKQWILESPPSEIRPDSLTKVHFRNGWSADKPTLITLAGAGEVRSYDLAERLYLTSPYYRKSFNTGCIQAFTSFQDNINSSRSLRTQQEAFARLGVMIEKITEVTHETGNYMNIIGLSMGAIASILQTLQGLNNGILPDRVIPIAGYPHVAEVVLNSKHYERFVARREEKAASDVYRQAFPRSLPDDQRLHEIMRPVIVVEDKIVPGQYQLEFWKGWLTEKERLNLTRGGHVSAPLRIGRNKIQEWINNQILPSGDI